MRRIGQVVGMLQEGAGRMARHCASSPLWEFKSRLDPVSITDRDVLASGIFLAHQPPELPPPLPPVAEAPPSVWQIALRQLSALKFIAGSPDAQLEMECVGQLLHSFAQSTSSYATAMSSHHSWMGEAALDLISTSVMPQLNEDPRTGSDCMLNGIRTLFAQQRYAEVMSLVCSVCGTECLSHWPDDARCQLASFGQASALATNSMTTPPPLMKLTHELLKNQPKSVAGALVDIMTARLESSAPVNEIICDDVLLPLLQANAKDCPEDSELSDLLWDQANHSNYEVMQLFVRSNARDKGQVTLLRSSLVLGMLLAGPRKHELQAVEKSLGSSLPVPIVQLALSRSTWEEALTAVLSRHNAAAHHTFVRKLSNVTYEAVLALQSAARLEIACKHTARHGSVDMAALGVSWDSALRYLSARAELGTLPTMSDLRVALQQTGDVGKSEETIHLFDALNNRVHEKECNLLHEADVSLHAEDVALFASAVLREGKWKRAIDVLDGLLRCDDAESSPNHVSTCLTDALMVLSKNNRWMESLKLACAVGPSHAAKLVENGYIYSSLRSAPGDVWLRALQAIPPPPRVKAAFFHAAKLVSTHDPARGIALLRQLKKYPERHLASSIAIGGWYRHLMHLFDDDHETQNNNILMMLLLQAMSRSQESITPDDIRFAAIRCNNNPNLLSALVRVARRHGKLRDLITVYGKDDDIGRLCIFLLTGELDQTTPVSIPWVARTITRCGIPYQRLLFRWNNNSNFVESLSVICRTVAHKTSSGRSLIECSPFDYGADTYSCDLLLVAKRFTVLRKGADEPVASTAMRSNLQQGKQQVALLQVPQACRGLCVLVDTSLPLRDITVSFTMNVTVEWKSLDAPSDSAVSLLASFSCQRVKLSVTSGKKGQEVLKLQCHTVTGFRNEEHSALPTEALALLSDGGWVLADDKSPNIESMSIVCKGRAYSVNLN